MSDSKPVGTLTISTEANADWLKSAPRVKDEVEILRSAREKRKERLKSMDSVKEV